MTGNGQQHTAETGQIGVCGTCNTALPLRFVGSGEEAALCGSARPVQDALLCRIG